MSVLRRRVALIVSSGDESPFKNGSVTQPFMMCLAFEHAGIDFDLYAQTGGTYFNYAVKPLDELLVATAGGGGGVDYAAVLMVCHLKAFGDSPELDALAKRTKLVHVLCGHHVIFTIEDMIFGQNRCADMLVNKYATETWVFEMHAGFRHVYEQWLGTSVKVYPYVWSNAIIDTHLRENALTPARVVETPRTPLTIVIAEPSLNVTKTCFLPLVAANAYARAHPDRVQRVIVLCKPSGPGFEAVVRYLDALVGKLELHDRLVWSGVACQLLARRDTVPVLLSHHFENALNFLTLESFYLGMPVVHNAAALRPAGFYYDGWRADEVHAQLDRIWNGERNEDVSHSVLGRYAPDNAEVVEGFKALMLKEEGL